MALMKLNGRRSTENGERQPLLASVPVSPNPPRYPRQSTLSRIVLSTLAVGLLYLLLNALFFPHLPPFSSPSVGARYLGSGHGKIPLEALERIMLVTPNEREARESSRYYTSGPHLGGKNLSQALWTQKLWESYGISDVSIATYEIYSNYPVSHALKLLRTEQSETADSRHEILYEASLEEDVLEEDATTGSEDRIPTFHGYSANGNVTAEYVYANYGTYSDYEDLISRGVNLTGRIVLCRYGAIFRGLKVMRAQELGAIGVVIYSDPGDDFGVTEKDGYKPYPKGPARNPSSVQRGSVLFLSYGPGDPTTPGYASLPNVPRQDPLGHIPSIPSLPISFTDALPILKALNGHGPNAADIGGDWTTGGLGYKDVEYNVGPAPGITLNLVNEGEFLIQPHHNVIGKIEGLIKDEVVFLGNHRDSWIVGGSGDPNSGSAALNEVIRAFGIMLSRGWKPLRTIVLASWDGEEAGLLGSTEWVEDHAKWLHANALAYLNVDVGVRYKAFDASGNPLLGDLLHLATKKVLDPASAEKGYNATVWDVWSKKMSTLGSGSDYTAWQDFLGVPSIDMGFSQPNHLDEPAVYHYHSNYDSFYWMEKFGDPGFHYHAAIAKIWGLIALQLAESPVVPFNVTAYATGLESYLKSIVNQFLERTDRKPDQVAHDNSRHQTSICDLSNDHNSSLVLRCYHPPCRRPLSEDVLRQHLKQLHHAICRLKRKAASFDAYASWLSKELQKLDTPWWRRIVLGFKARKVNLQLKNLDRCFVSPGGLDERPFFKHVVYAPSKWNGYVGDTFPGLVEGIREGNWTKAIKWSRIIKHSVELADKAL